MTTSPQRFARPNTPPAPPLRFNYADAVESMKANTKAHHKGKNTIKSYEGHIKRGREFLKKFAAEERAAQKAFTEANGQNNTNEGEEEALGGEQNISADPNFVFAFDGPPKPCTPTALALFINWKCFEEDLTGGTAYSIYSAFKWHYDTMCGDRYRGKWECDETTERCCGNPTQSAEVLDLVESCQKKDGEKERSHSKATSIEDMEAMYAESLCVCPEDFVPRTQADIAFMTTHLLWRAVSAFGFTIWTRNFETTNFRYGGIDFVGRERPVYGANPIDQLEFFRISLRERKNWQRKMKKGEQQMNGHVYNVYPLSASTSTPSIHLYKHLLIWLDFCEKYLLQRPWHPNDYPAKIPNGELLTTHCFRRGGAQYRFMFAPPGQKWTLSRIRWWGGWALGEKRDTLIRYLLDELYTYEEDHSDALKPGDTDISASGSHAGEALEMRPLTVAEGKQLLSATIPSIHVTIPHHPTTLPLPTPHITQHQTVHTSVGSYNSNSFGHPFPQAPSFPPAVFPSHRYPSTASVVTYGGSSDPIPYATTPFSHPVDAGRPQQTRRQATSSTRPLPVVPSRWRIPEISHKAGHDGWKQVVRDWKVASPPEHTVPLKDWQPEWYKGLGGQHTLYLQRKSIALEFIEEFDEDIARFIAYYGNATKNVTALFKAIQANDQVKAKRLTRAKKT
ncbi:hypothetical protein FA13DRAFT_1757041 [Coprinellus micaceus]|uniref:Uncharacterized protein n=1 Tax=Coprinellus micaceus TaxID=71717 RepID=A0A4Y7SP42_COPMI|nr:hypothetical protein FA13DRAFT_1757041 [Coprinellus micaceus]